jgi:Tfp pilus assembly protein PilF
MRNAFLVVLIVSTLSSFGCKSSPEIQKREALERGKKRLASGDYARAALEFKTAAQADPNDAETYYQAALAYIGTQELRPALAALRKATELNPKHTLAQIKLSEMLSAAPRNSGLLQNAERRMEALLASSPDNTDALSALAFAELRLGQFGDAEKHLSQALAIGPANLKAAVGLAQVRIAQNRPADAEAILRNATAQKPALATPFIVMGEFYLSRKRPADARREFMNALEVEKNNQIALLYIAGIQLMSGETDEAGKTWKRVSELPDSRNKTIYARFLFYVGRRDQGVKELERLFSESPHEHSIRRDLVSAYLTVNRAADAERILSAALKAKPTDTDALLDRARVYLVADKAGDASVVLNEVLKYDPNSAQAHYLLARIYEIRGKTIMFRDELAQAVRFNPELLTARLKLARLLIASNLSQSALNLMNETPDWQKQNPEVIAQRNWALLATGSKEEMRNGLALGLTQSRSPELLLQDAVLKIEHKDLAGARVLLEEVLSKLPEDTRALDILALTYLKQGQPAAALRRIRDHAKLHAKSPRVLQYLGAWLQRSELMDEARQAFMAAKDADKSFWLADVSLAALDLTENKVDTACTRLAPLLAHPHAGIQARSLFAIAEQKRGNLDGTIEHYKKIIEQEPNNVFALNELAYALAEYKNLPDEALKLAERAKALAPQNAAIDDTLGWILYKKGAYSSAVQHLERSVRNQANATRHAHLASAYAKYGDKVRGLAQLQAAVKLNPELPEIATARKLFTTR